MIKPTEQTAEELLTPLEVAAGEWARNGSQEYDTAYYSFIEGHDFLLPALTEAHSIIAALEALVPKWIDVKANPKWLNGIDPYRTVVLFDNGEILFYDNNWPFAEAIAAFELPEALTPNQQ